MMELEKENLVLKKDFEKFTNYLERQDQKKKRLIESIQKLSEDVERLGRPFIFE